MVLQPDNVKAIYPDVLGADQWFLNPDTILTDQRFQTESELTGDGLYGFSTNDRSPRFKIVGVSGYTDGGVASNVDHANAANLGYLFSYTDWRDIEVGGYFKFIQVDSYDCSIFFAVRGAEHVGSHGCQGCNYFVELRQDGYLRFGKEQWHVSNAYKEWKNVLGTTGISKGWFGFKFVVYNIGIGRGSAQGVKLECWMDLRNTNQWTKVSETIDSGGWGNRDNCGDGTPADQILSFGGPLIILGFESQTQIMFKLLSARTVAPGAEFRAVPQSVSGDRVYASLRMHYRIGVNTSPTCQTETPTDPNPPPPPPEPGKITVLKKIANRYNILQ